MDEEKDRLFEELVLPCLDALYGFGLLLTGRSSEAEDLVQDTVLRAYRFFRHYQQGTNCKAWLFTIMKHIFLNQATHRAREVLCPYQSGESDALWEDLMNQAQGSSDLRHEVFSQDIQKALGLLPSSSRLMSRAVRTARRSIGMKNCFSICSKDRSWFRLHQTASDRGSGRSWRPPAWKNRRGNVSV